MDGCRVMKRIAFLLPLLSGVCFGSVGIFIRFFSEAGFNNMAILCTRNAISAVLLFLFMFIYDRNLLKCRMRDLPILLGGGIIGMTLTNIFYNLAVLNLSLGFAGVLIGLSPVYVVIIATFLFGEKITRRKSMGMVLACYESENMPKDSRTAYLEVASRTLSHARPTTSAKMQMYTGRILDAAKAAMELR